MNDVMIRAEGRSSEREKLEGCAGDAKAVRESGADKGGGRQEKRRRCAKKVRWARKEFRLQI
jgi:hypothetical protein